MNRLVLGLASMAAGYAAVEPFGPLYWLVDRQVSSDEIENQMNALPLVQMLQADERYRSTRAWNNVQTTHYTAHTLAGGAAGLGRPLLFVDEKNKEIVSVVHCGLRLCGFPFVVHGGVLATLLDESLGRTSFLGLDDTRAVTAKLTMRYVRPVLANQFVVLRTRVDQAKDRKATCTGTIATLDGKTLVEAEGLFVVPRSYSPAPLDGL